MFDIRFSNRMGERIMSGGRDWDQLMPNVEVTLNCDDKSRSWILHSKSEQRKETQ